jgi:hypothetical protein
MITYTWVFESFECVDYEELKNVVKVIRWHLIGADGDYSSTVLGVTTVEDVNPDSFITFENITEEKAMEWISYYENIPAIKSDITSHINNQKNVEVLSSLSPPWIVV